MKTPQLTRGLTALLTLILLSACAASPKSSDQVAQEAAQTKNGKAAEQTADKPKQRCTWVVQGGSNMRRKVCS